MRRRLQGLRYRVKRVVRYVLVDIWRIPLRELSGGRSLLVTLLRIIVLALRGVREDQVLLRAPALTLYSLFSIVPAAALFLSIAGSFGLEAFMERQLQQALTGREELYYWVMELTSSFLRRLHGGGLALAGVGILLYTLTMLLNNMERSFNEIWNVERARSLSRRFSDYLAIIFTAPLFLILAGAANVFLTSQARIMDSFLLSPLLFFLVRLLPYLVTWTVFTMLYMIMPNTSVRFIPALIAGIVAGSAFNLGQWAYLTFQLGAANFGVIYGSFAALPLLIAWMQTSWLIVLFGAELAYAGHNVVNYEYEAETRNMHAFNRKALCLYVLHMLISSFRRGNPPVSPEEISKTLEVPGSLVRMTLNELIAVDLVSETRLSPGDKYAYQPALDINLISVRLVLERLDHRGWDELPARSSSTLEQLKATLKQYYELLDESEGSRLLKDYG